MATFQQQRLARFVDRESEMNSFCKMLDGDWPRPILAVWGEGGMGKSSLLLRMVHECSLRSLSKVEINWSDTRNYDYLAVMRKIRDDLGAPQFSGFTDLVNFYTVPRHRLEVVVETNAPIDVARNATFGPNAQVGFMGGVVLQPGAINADLMLNDARTDLGISESDRMAQLTDSFVRELNALALQGRVVIFLDAIEKATNTTQRWIWDELFGALRADRLANVLVVIGGRNQPVIDEDWRLLVEERRLGPLSREHIVEYMIKREIAYDAAQREIAADVIFDATQGNPLSVASTVEAMSRRQGMKA
ncbi:hypothetical protein ABIB73_004573 [Bradyrhizobium sp. F1.4.3]|uniref:hypothetical protein n=1 Tax=Bradyrhizobium sp. F1.4.3 TaxID=3156356 RepID=UPI0033908A36